MRRIALVAVVASAAVAATVALAHGQADATRAAPAAAAKTRVPTYYGDVRPILEGRCVSCHRLGGIAPFALTSYTAARAHRKEVAYAVSHRIMPPWLAKPGVRAYRYDPSLSKAQIATIVRWANHGAPRGNAKTVRAPEVVETPQMSRVDLRVELPEPYLPKPWLPGGDDYRCFVVPWQGDHTQFVTGFNAIPDERTEVHHIIAFLAGPSDAATVDAWDAAEEGPGYRCFGGASAVGGRQIAPRLIGGWAPGGMGGDFPVGTGLQIEPGSRLILQFHYHPHGTIKPDRSVLEFEVAETVTKRAAVLPVVNFAWIIAPSTMAIPPGGKPSVHEAALDPRIAQRLFAQGVDLANGFMIDAAILHMHRLGVSADLTLQKASGEKVALLSIPRWDFDWQRSYYLRTPQAFEPGDQLSIRCTHKNTTKRVVTWGESTTDEMCIGFVYVSER